MRPTQVDSDSCFKGRPQLSRGPHCGLLRRVIHEPAAASRAVSGALSMALFRKYSGFNLYSAVPVPTQSSAALAGGKRVELLSPGSKPVELTIVLTPNKSHQILV